MKKRRKKQIPAFRNEAAEARFWATRDLADFLDGTEAIDETIELAPHLERRIRERTRKKLLTIRLEAWRIERAKRIAKKMGVPYQTLIRTWISEGIKRASG